MSGSKSTTVIPGDGKSDWYNLGYWDGASSFPDACKTLAEKLGLFAGLESCPHLLDIGPGYGAQLDLWKTVFRIEKITAVEPDRSAFVRAMNYSSAHIKIYNTRLETFRFPEGVHSVIAADSCYHIPFEKFWHKLAETGGVTSVVLSDLFLLKRPTAWIDLLFLRLVAIVSKIPFENFRTKEQYLSSSPFRLTSWEDVSEQVLDGFCFFVQRNLSGRWLQILASTSKLKVFCTYLIVKRLRARGLAGYAFILMR
jgi:hypothetical protein